MMKQTRLVYVVLTAVWLMITVWQIVEHRRVQQTARVALINRARDISTTVGIVLRSQRHLITKERLEAALNSLVKPEELNSVALLNASGGVVASAGHPIDLEMRDLVPKGEHWGDRVVALMNLVDIGTNLTFEAEASRPRIVVPRDELFNRPERPAGMDGPPNPPPERRGPGRDRTGASALNDNSDPASEEAPAGPGRSRFRGDRRPSFFRPFGMTDEEWKATVERKGVHSFIIVMSTQSMLSTIQHDLWLRVIISALASVAVFGLGLAWSNLVKSGELELRLVRAAELNTRLREMSFAAAGLAHETKNPLNIIRGLAQIISKQPDTSLEVRRKTQGIMDEADRVTAQVNEFINFSRPRQLRLAPVALSAAVAEVARALEPDLEEKALRLEVQEDLPVIEADEQQLRQALFNLLINAIQAVDRGGHIQVAAVKKNSGSAILEVCDDGPGVPQEHRTDVFKPYFTTNQKGTGLGLAVVQQTVLAHGWEIECLPNEPKGALFRISHLRLAASL